MKNSFKVLCLSLFTAIAFTTSAQEYSLNVQLNVLTWPIKNINGYVGYPVHPKSEIGLTVGYQHNLELPEIFENAPTTKYFRSTYLVAEYKWFLGPDAERNSGWYASPFSKFRWASIIAISNDTNEVEYRTRQNGLAIGMGGGYVKHLNSRFTISAFCGVGFYLFGSDFWHTETAVTGISPIAFRSGVCFGVKL